MRGGVGWDGVAVGVAVGVAAGVAIRVGNIGVMQVPIVLFCSA